MKITTIEMMKMTTIEMMNMTVNLLTQASLEAEIKGKQEALRVKKKIEADINDLEMALDHANKSNSEEQKQVSD